MKTFYQRQYEKVEKARFDGGYPRLVILPMGIVALARKEDEYNRLMRQRRMLYRIYSIAWLVALVVAIAGVLWRLQT